MKILICGPNGSGKKTLAEPLTKLLKDKCTVIIQPVTDQHQIDEIGPDYVVWMDTSDKPSFKPNKVNYHISAWFNDTHTQLAEVIIEHILKKEKTT